MKNGSKLYLNPVIYYMFLLAGVILFVYLSLNIKLDVVQNVKANIKDDRIIIEGEYNTKSDAIYLYNDRNEKIYKLTIEHLEYIDGQTVFIINNTTELFGDIQADIVTGSQTLLERIFIRAGKG
ncbi:MAG: hypothetical protein N2645_14935 [Clostridia bacterium]|nr:hypothetical protein [Clostridia bacterium]